MNSKELSFESFNFQIAWVKYKDLGDFEYDYNTHGAEFFLTLKKDCPELNLKSRDIVGWQAKFWLNHKDMNNTQMGSKQRGELKDGLERALKQKSKLKAWIICTPGQIEAGARKKLEDELCAIKSDLVITFWNKPIYEAYYLEDHERFNPIFAHYLSSQFIGYEFLNNYHEKTCKHNKKIELPGDEDIIALLDGQQRTTSLLTALYGGKIKGKGDFDPTLYFDISIKSESDTDDETYKKRS